MSRTQNHRKLFDDLVKVHQKKVSIPTLHVFGDTDRSVYENSDKNVFLWWLLRYDSFYGGF